MAIITANAWFAFIFGISMQPLFDMINSLQVSTLLALTNINLPANAMKLYEVLVSIVGFELLPVFDPGFTETEPYSTRFDWFGVGSVNYLQALGSLLCLLIVLLLLMSIVSACIYREVS